MEAGWYYSKDSSEYNIFQNGQKKFDESGEYVIKYIDTNGCETFRRYTVVCQPVGCNCTIANVIAPVQNAVGSETEKDIITFTSSCENEEFTAVPEQSDKPFITIVRVSKDGTSTTTYKVYATISKNTVFGDEGNRTQEVKIYSHNSSEDACTSVTITQLGVGCVCKELTFTPSKNLTWKADEYGMQKTISLVCDVSSLGECLNAQSFACTTEGEYADKFTVTPVPNVPYRYSVYPKEENTEDDEYTAQIVFKYKLTGHDEYCEKSENVVTLTQSNATCECNNLIKNPCLLKTLPTNAGTYEIGTGETHSCGYFTGDSSSSQVEEVSVTTQNEISTFKVKVKRTSSDASSDVNIRFIYNDESEGQNSCYDTITITQTDYYVNCERLSNVKIQDKILYYIEETTNDVEIARLYANFAKDFNAFYMKDLIEFITDPDASSWLSNVRFEMNNGTGIIKATITGNPETNRTTKIIAKLKEEKAKMFGICNCDETVSWNLTQYCTCDCMYYDNEEEHEKISLKAEQDSTHVSTYDYPNKCLDKVNGETFVLICEEEGVIITCSPSYGDLIYTDLPVSDPWFHIGTYPETDNNGHTEYNVVWKWDENDTGEPRNISITQQLYLKGEDGLTKTCEVIRDFEQSFITQKTCESYFAQTLYNVKSGNTDSNAIIRYDGIDPNHTGGVSIAAYDSDKPGGVNDYKLRGEVMDGSTWLHFTNYDGNVLYANVDENIKKPLSKDNDGSTEERRCKIRIWLVDENGSVVKDKDGISCTGVTAYTYQEGFTGYCPACNSMHDTDITVKYNGYGEGGMQCDGVPAFHGDASTQLSLFECNLSSNIIKAQGGANITCFGLLAETDHNNFVEGTLTAVAGSSATNYIIKGKLKPNTGGKESVSIKLYLTKRNFITGGYEKCEETLQEGHIIHLPNGQTTCD